MFLLLLPLALAQAPSPIDAVPAVPTSGTFQSGKATVTPAGEDALRPWVDALLANPSWVCEVSAHTDSQGSGAYNLRMSQERAEGAMAALIEAGVDPAQLVAKGYGEDRPVASNDTPEGQAQNRRLELTRIGPGSSAAAPAEYTGPRQWIGFSPELSGELRSGDEAREGKLQIDTQTVDVPVGAEFELYFFHSRDNQPTAALLGPSGERIPLTPGKSSAMLSKGRWTVRVEAAKREEGPWGLRMKGAGPNTPPGPGAPACVVLDYWMAQSHADMRDVRGPAIDDNFTTLTVQLPRLPGEGVIHHADAIWHALYEGSDTAQAEQVAELAELTLLGCLGSTAWDINDTGWTTMSYTFAPETTWDARTLSFTQPADDRTMLIKIEQERREDSAKATLYLYQKDLE